MKNKIIALISIIIVIIGILSISTFAYDYSDYYGLIISNGTTIVFNDTLIKPETDFNQSISFRDQNGQGTGYISISVSGTNGTSWKVQYENDSGYFNNAYTTGSWNSNYKQTIKLRQDYVLDDNELSRFLIDNVNTGLPVPPIPPVYEGALENTNAMFGTTLSVMTVIITWLLANQIALCGLYLYILIACIGIGKRFVKT